MLADLRLLEMDGIEAADLELLAALFDGFSQRTRLAILLGLYHGNSTQEIADVFNLSRAGLTNHYEKMQRAYLLQSAESGYELTPFGRFFAEWVLEEYSHLLEAGQLLQETEKEVREELTEEVNPDYISEKEWERLVNRELWKRVEPELEAILFD